MASVKIEIVKADITKQEVDVIVNAANSSLAGGGGVDGAIHRAAGKELYFECRLLGGCGIGEAKITRGYNLPSKLVIHTVGPKYRGGEFGEEERLRESHINSLSLAEEYKCTSMAFPAISTGIYGYPLADAARVALTAVKEHAGEHIELVRFCLFDDAALAAFMQAAEDLGIEIANSQTAPAAGDEE